MLKSRPKPFDPLARTVDAEGRIGIAEARTCFDMEGLDSVVVLIGPDFLHVMTWRSWLEFRERALELDGEQILEFATAEGVESASFSDAEPPLHRLDAEGMIRLSPDAMKSAGIGPGEECLLFYLVDSITIHQREAFEKAVDDIDLDALLFGDEQGRATRECEGK